jgi:DNA-binding Lrp family transcriptional regulator
MNMQESMTADAVDHLDRKILHALQINGRAAFSLIGDVIGVSEQTVARRYRRLRVAGVVRVVGVVDPAVLGQLDWVVRITCRPNAAMALGDALAARDDVAWVSLTGAGNEIMASLRARTQDARDELLLRRLPKTEQVLNLSAAIVMHRFTGRYDNDWRAYTGGLGDIAVAALASTRIPPTTKDSRPADRIQPEDRNLIAALGVDGRTPIAALAASSGWNHARTRRRLDDLIGSGAVYIDVDLSAPALGFPLLVMLWLTIEPQHLDTFGNALVDDDAVTFAAATTGSSNLTAAVALTGVDALYQFVSRIDDMAPGLRHLEVAPVIRRVKQAGSMVDGERLRDPAPAVRTDTRR